MAGALSDEEVASYQSDGFVRLTHAFPRALAEECIDLLWEQLPVRRDEPTSWQQPLLAVPSCSDPEFRESVTTPRLVAALQQLLGDGAWRRPAAAGPFIVRFPSQSDPGDTGWYADGHFERTAALVAVARDGRVLSLLSLYTDVAANDAPVRLVRGSHLVQGAPAAIAAASSPSDVVPAVGRAGDVYLGHPAVVHASSFPQRGNRPRVMAQQALLGLA